MRSLYVFGNFYIIYIIFSDEVFVTSSEFFIDLLSVV